MANERPEHLLTDHCSLSTDYDTLTGSQKKRPDAATSGLHSYTRKLYLCLRAAKHEKQSPLIGEGGFVSPEHSSLARYEHNTADR